MNGVALGQTGASALGSAARFDGFDDHVLTPRTVAGSFTLEMWINTSAPSVRAVSFSGTR